MATLHVRRFPDALYRRLAKLAGVERRSLGAEVTVLIERALARPAQAQRAVLQTLDRVRFRPGRASVPTSLELLRADRNR